MYKSTCPMVCFWRSENKFNHVWVPGIGLRLSGLATSAFYQLSPPWSQDFIKKKKSLHVLTYIALYVSLHASPFIRVLCRNPRVGCQLGCLTPVALMSRDSFVSCAWKGKEVICLDPSSRKPSQGHSISCCTSLQRWLHS